jgi:hypothetical protein
MVHSFPPPKFFPQYTIVAAISELLPVHLYRVLREVLLCHQRFRYCYFKSASVGGSVLCDSGCQVEEQTRVGIGLSLELIVVV